ncbi:hypothetical protein P8452_42618 [Trifolium repens]|nr:hypothetical protein P8452_42618 [Trifolium repens]
MGTLEGREIGSLELKIHGCLSIGSSKSILWSTSKLRVRIKLLLQVDRLTGARTRMELMIGAELGSSQ